MEAKDGSQQDSVIELRISYHWASIKRDGEFDRVALGDVPNPRVTYYRTSWQAPPGNTTLLSSVMGISLKTLTDYDGAHPAGSSLADVARVEYHSFDKALSNPPSSGELLGPFSDYYAIALSDFAPIRGLNMHKGRWYNLAGDLEAVGAIKLRFVSPPTTPDQRMEVRLRLGDGTEFASEVTARFAP